MAREDCRRQELVRNDAIQRPLDALHYSSVFLENSRRRFSGKPTTYSQKNNFNIKTYSQPCANTSLCLLPYLPPMSGPTPTKQSITAGGTSNKWVQGKGVHRDNFNAFSVHCRDDKDEREFKGTVWHLSVCHRHPDILDLAANPHRDSSEPESSPSQASKNSTNSQWRP